MKQFVLVAGVDYEFKGVDFRLLCDNRRKRLTAANTAREDLKFTTLDFRSGVIDVTMVTFPDGSKVETTSRTATFAPVNRGSYTTVTYPDGTSHTRFKPGQSGVLSILDVYASIRAIGAADPGTLAELSFFSHGWMGGPLLINSDDDRSAVVPAPSVSPAATTVTLSLIGTTLRDPDDKDPRAQFDFVAPTMDAAALANFRKAFASDGLAWLWGCAFPKVVHHALTAIERCNEYRSTGLSDDDEMTLTRLNAEDVFYLERVLKPLLGPFPAPRTTVKIRFKYLKYFLCVVNRSSYAARFADASNVSTLAAPLGTYTVYDSGTLPLMSVFSGFTRHFTLYRNYLGMTFDAERRNYGTFLPGTSCPVPSP